MEVVTMVEWTTVYFLILYNILTKFVQVLKSQTCTERGPIRKSGRTKILLVSTLPSPRASSSKPS